MRVVHVDVQDATPSACVSEGDRGGVWAIGNFDGLHRGHQALFQRAIHVARMSEVSAGALTFSPHPARVLNPSLAPPLILTDAERVEGIAAAGVDVLAIVQFTHATAQLGPDDFVRNVLRQKLCASAVVVGEGFRFGHRAAGTADDLRRLGLRTEVVPPVREGDLVCSSSKIREMVLAGKVEAAARLLGRPYRIVGLVVRGDGRGRTIGIPTANLSTDRDLLPRVGVYATRAILEDGRVVPSVTNIGLRPTFAGEGVRIETHLLDFHGDLYGQRLLLDLVGRVRDEQRFSSVDMLVSQIRLDVALAQEMLSGST